MHRRTMGLTRRSVFVILVPSLLAVSCAGPDPEHDGFVLIDSEARASGIALELDGERTEAVLPVAVPAGEPARILRPGEGDEVVVLAPGETLEVTGPEGVVRRAWASRDSLVVSGSYDAVAAFAELTGATGRPAGDGRYLLEGTDVWLLAAWVGQVPGITGASAVAPARASYTSALLEGRSHAAEQAARAHASGARADCAGEGPLADAASLVGVYEGRGALMILDAAGGYTIRAGGEERRGTVRPCPGSVVFEPDDGGAPAVMLLRGEDLVDDLDITYTP